MGHDSKGRTRAFLALETSPATRTTLGELCCRLEPLLPSARFVPPDRVHLTLHFFASLDVDGVETVKAVAGIVAATVDPYRLQLGGIGVFPDVRRPRVLWVGLREGRDETTRLASRLGDELETSGLAPDRKPFRPHVTIARFKSPHQLRVEEAIRLGGSVEFGGFPADCIVLFRSWLERLGPRYSVIDRWPLGGKEVA